MSSSKAKALGPRLRSGCGNVNSRNMGGRRRSPPGGLMFLSLGYHSRGREVCGVSIAFVCSVRGTQCKLVIVEWISYRLQSGSQPVLFLPNPSHRIQTLEQMIM